MDDLEKRNTEMVLRVDNFGTANTTPISRFPKAAAAFGVITTGIVTLEEKGVLRASAGEIKLSQTARRAFHRNQVHNDMSWIVSNARQAARENPGFVNKYRLPRANKSDLVWIESARQFAQDLPADKQYFLDLAVDPDFIEDLITHTDAFEESISSQDMSNRERIGADADIDDILGAMLKAVRTLKVMVPNIFRGNPGKLAEWAAACHVEKAAKTKPKNPPTA